MAETTPLRDRWAAWLLEHRFGGRDPDQRRKILDELERVRDPVLEHAAVREGDVLLDVGAGDGLIAFGALPLVGRSGRVIFSDISPDLLDHAAALARQMGMADRVEFLRSAADDLSAVADASVDIVTTRSVLIYVSDKGAAL